MKKTSNESRAQTGIETILVSGVIISLLVVLGAYYFGDVSDQTTAIIILKTELLKQFSGMEKNYVLSSSLEPKIQSNPERTLCFEVGTIPKDLSAASPGLDLDTIKQKISAKTRYESVEIKVNDAVGCP